MYLFTRGPAERISGCKTKKTDVWSEKSAIPELNFGHENLRFLHEMWPNEAAKKSRKIPFLSPSRRKLYAKDILEKLDEKTDLFRD